MPKNRTKTSKIKGKHAHNLANHFDRHKMNIKLFDIFIPVSEKPHYTKQELLMLDIKKDFIDQISKQLNLTYLENGNKNGNLCFVNDENLRPEFKAFFSKSDVMEYLNSILVVDDFDIKTDEAEFPEISTFFK